MEDQKQNTTHSAGLGRERSTDELKKIDEQEKAGEEQKKNEEETLDALKEVAGEDTGINQANMPAGNKEEEDADKVGPGPDLNAGSQGSTTTDNAKQEEVIK